MKDIINICFFFPYYEDSGVPVLFYRMSNAIALSYPNRIVYVIDYKDGAIARNVDSRYNIRVLEFEKGKIIVPPEDAILVMQSFVPYYWPVELKPTANTRLFFWNLHPHNLVPSLLPLPFLRDLPKSNITFYRTLSLFYPKLLSALRSYVNYLIHNKALSFMDKTNYDTTARCLSLNIAIDNYLPVPVINNSNIKKLRNNTRNNQYNFCWVGRVCDFKVHILIYTINKLAEVAELNKIKILYYIIGDGECFNYLTNNLVENSYFKTKILGSMPHKNLDKFLLDEVDVLTAMGTSALEGAKLAIPTILLDASYKQIRGDYIFRLLHDTKDFDLAHFISKDDFLKGNNSLDSIVKLIINNYCEESDKVFCYFSENHKIESVTSILLNLASNSKLEFGMLNKDFFKKPLLLRVYNKFRKL